MSTLFYPLHVRMSEKLYALVDIGDKSPFSSFYMEVSASNLKFKFCLDQRIEVFTFNL